MEIDFNVNQLINQVGLIGKNKFTQSELNEIIETCFKISYSFLTSKSLGQLNLNLSEEEKIDLCTRAISPFFEKHKESIQINLNKAIQAKVISTSNTNELFYALFDLIRESTMKELTLRKEHLINYS